MKSDYGFHFGGFTSEAWNSNDGLVYDPTAFIFSLTHHTIHKCKEGKGALRYLPNTLCVFGEESDINIADNCNLSNNLSHSYFGSSYELPEGITY